jgi:curli biogenesis system outer membrane secretion channel CsgG
LSGYRGFKLGAGFSGAGGNFASVVLVAGAALAGAGVFAVAGFARGDGWSGGEQATHVSSATRMQMRVMIFTTFG